MCVLGRKTTLTPECQGRFPSLRSVKRAAPSCAALRLSLANMGNRNGSNKPFLFPMSYNPILSARPSTENVGGLFIFKSKTLRRSFNMEKQKTIPELEAEKTANHLCSVQRNPSDSETRRSVHWQCEFQCCL